MSMTHADALNLRARRVFAEVRMLLEAAKARPADGKLAVNTLEHTGDMISMAGGNTGRPSSALKELHDMLWHLGDREVEALRKLVAAGIMSPEYDARPVAPDLPPPHEGKVSGIGEAEALRPAAKKTGGRVKS